MASPDPIKSGFDEKDIQLLRGLVPLHTLPDDAFTDLLKDLQIESFRRGDILFKEGDTDNLSFYLLQGRMSLLSGKRVVDTIAADGENARFPIAHVLPRKHTGRAIGRGRVARLDSRRLSELLARTHKVDYEVGDLETADSGDWMSLLLQSPVLQQLPAANIQRVMMSVEQVEVEKGEQIIRQGDPGDYFYILIQGTALVTRQEIDGKSPKELATLGPGSAFGEEALLSASPRNSTITMLAGGQVLRLAKRHFLELVQSPLTRHIGFDEAVAKVEKGAVWIDLRSPQDYEKDHFPGSVNLQIESLRYQISSLAPDRHYVLYSNSGGRAAVAAFLLTDQGFDVSLLEGGLNRLREDQPEAKLPEPVAESVKEDAVQEASELQRRVQEAEQRARELEQELKTAEATVHDAEQRNQQHLLELKGTVDTARERLVATEQEKDAALVERQIAYSEMEALTSNLEKLESERGELADRMREIEGLDGKLQTRLEKVERQLIGERERAESASESLEDISQRLNEVMEERQLERDRHARESGELKEEMTALQLELEQAVSELEELRADQQASVAADGSIQQELTEKVGQLEKLEKLLESLQAEALDTTELLAGKDVQLAEQKDRLITLQKENASLGEQVARQGETLTEREQAQQLVKKQVEELQEALADRSSALEQAKTQLDTAQQWEPRAAAAEQRAGELEARLGQADQESARLADLKEQLDASHEALACVEQERDQLQTQARELEEQLGKSTEQAEALSAREGELAALRTELEQQRDQLQAQTQELESLSGRAGEQAEALSAREAELDALRAELDKAGEWKGRAEDAQARVTELEQTLESAAVAGSDLASATEALEASRKELAGRQEQQAALESDLHQLQEQNEVLREEAKGHQQALEAARTELGNARELLEQHNATGPERDKELERLREAQGEFERERKTLTEELEQRQGEVDDLRSVMETYIDEIKAAQDANTQQGESSRELEELRAQLAAVQLELEQSREDSSESFTAAELESMRQEMLDLKQSLEERQNALLEAEETRHTLEDAVEDANAEVDKLRREMDQLAIDAEEAGFHAEEAAKARKQLEEEILRFQKEAEAVKVADFRDERVHIKPLALDINSVWNGSWVSRLISIGLGASVALGVLELLSFMAGRGELIGSLLK